jgi:hypothetical protein
MKDNLFDLASSLRDVKISINKTPILDENILEMEIHWDSKKFEVHASMMLKDNMDLLASFENFDKNVVNIFITDLQDNVVSRDFYIANMNEVKGDGENTKTLVIDLIDVISFTLKNSFISKGYSNCSLSYIINDLFKIFKIETLFDKKYITLDLSETKEIYENIVIPQDRSVLDFLEFQLNLEGSILFQQNTSIVLKNITEVLPSVLKKDQTKNFKEDVENVNYQYKILEFTAEYSSAYSNLQLPSTSSFVFDPKTKAMIKLESNISDIWDNIKSSNTDEKYIQSTDILNGGKCFRINENNSKDRLTKETFFHYIENTFVEIFVPGQTKGNNLLEKRGCSFKGSTLHIEGLAEGNTILGGDYIVLKIHDKILGNKMIHRIMLGRANNTGKASS